jgi:tRNA-Thr(GGU) m(6)t(6)A37 methyltransferase TsaA
MLLNMRAERNGIVFRPIGVVRSPHTDPSRTPIQPRYAKDIEGRIEIYPQYEEGLTDVEGFSHIVVLFHLHRARSARLMVIPFMDTTPRGVFATRSPSRPNPIGMSVVRLLRREGRVLHIADVDMLDGTPVIDIKPHIARFGVDDPVSSGWQERITEEEADRLGRRAA